MNWPWVSRRAYELLERELELARQTAIGQETLLRQDVRELRGELAEARASAPIEVAPSTRKMAVIPSRLSVDLAGRRLERESRTARASAEFLAKGDA